LSATVVTISSGEHNFSSERDEMFRACVQLGGKMDVAFENQDKNRLWISLVKFHSSSPMNNGNQRSGKFFCDFPSYSPTCRLWKNHMKVIKGVKNEHFLKCPVFRCRKFASFATHKCSRVTAKCAGTHSIGSMEVAAVLADELPKKFPSWRPRSVFTTTIHTS